MKKIEIRFSLYKENSYFCRSKLGLLDYNIN